MSICEIHSWTSRSRSRGVHARLLPFMAVVILLCSAPRSSRASPDYPARIQDDLGMPCAPPCTVCHRDNRGGLGTVAQPFGKAMMAAGLRFFAPQTIDPALAELEAQRTDSDGDGQPDVLELSAGRDPNGDLDLCGLTPRFGCGAQIAPSPPDSGLGLLVAILTGVVLGVAAQRSTGRRNRL
jgi:hypothetical protein